MLARVSGVDSDPSMDIVRRRDVDQLDARVAEELTIVGVERGDAVPSSERFGIPARRRGDSDDLRLLRHHFHRSGDAVRLEARPDDADPYFPHCQNQVKREWLLLDRKSVV